MSEQGAAAPINQAELMARAKDQYGAWRLPETKATLEELLANPGKHEVPALNLYADVLWSLGELEGAKRAAGKLLEIAPLDHQAARRARWLKLPTDPARLSSEWTSAIISSGVKPAAVYPPLVRLLNEEGQHELALSTAERGLAALSLFKSDERIVNKLILEVAIAKEKLGNYSGALEALSKINPDLPVAKSAALSRARMLHEMGRFSDAEGALSEYFGSPEPAFNVTRYHILLSYGRIQDAFHLYKSRKETAVFQRLIDNYSTPPSSFEQGTWRNKNLLVLSEGGPGDEVRMSSLYGDILAHCQSVTFSCDPRLESLLARTYPDAHFVRSSRSRDELRKSDYWERSEVKDLLGAKLLTNAVLQASKEVQHTTSAFEFLADLRPDRASFRSAHRRNLSPDPALVAAWMQEMKPGVRRIGLAWRSMIVNSTRQKHYFSLEDLRPLAKLPGIEFWILQPEVTSEEIRILQEYLPEVRVPAGVDLVEDFEAQAALISCLDAVVSPCTTTAELAGAVGTETIILANTHMTAWRQNPDGSDVWHPSGKLVLGAEMGNRDAVIRNAVNALNGKPFVPESAVRQSSPPQAPTPNSKRQKSAGKRLKKLIATVPGARGLREYLRYLMLPRRKGMRAAVTAAIEAKAKALLREKSVTPAHVENASAAAATDHTRVMLAVQATLQARMGQFRIALATASQLPRADRLKSAILPAIRTEMSDLGRHDLAKKGLRQLLDHQDGDPEQAAVRMGNAEFEEEAYKFLSALKQPEHPKGYVVVFGLNNRVTLGLMTPIAWRLVKDGYHVCSSVAAAMRPADLPQLKGISGAIRWSGLSLTDEPFGRRDLRNGWQVDLPSRSVVCDGINYFTFFAERLGKFSNSYNVDVNRPEVLAAFDGLLHRSDVALTACKRILKLADEGKPIRLAAMDTHFAPAGIVRQWCEEVGRAKGIELVALSISYENYYSNLTTIEAKTISVENLSANPNVRHPLFGGRQRFEQYIRRHPETLVARDEALVHVRMNRSRTEEGDPAFRDQVLEAIAETTGREGKVFSALGKVLIDFAAPYDRGHTFKDFADWIRFLVEEVRESPNLLILKPHPHERRTEIAAPGVQTLRDLLPKALPPNVIFLDHATFNSFELAEQVDLNFVWNGTAYVEFPVLGKPVVAESIWAERDYPVDGLRLTSEQAYRDVLSGRVSPQLSEATIRKCVAFLSFMKSPEVAIPFGYVKRAGTNKSIGSISFLRDSLKKISHKDPGLALAASRFFETTE